MKPKIGILFLTSGWLRDVGLQSSESMLSKEVDGIANEIISILAQNIEPVYPGVLYSEVLAKVAAEKILAANVDGLIVSPLMWCEDHILRAALKQLPRLPLLVCTFFPAASLPSYVHYSEMLKGSGSVGTLQMSGFLKRGGYHYRSVTGHFRDDNIYREIYDHCRAFSIKRMLRETICGVLPFRCDQMSATYVDEFAIRTLYGVELKYLELQHVKSLASQITEKEIDEFKSQLTDYVMEVDEMNLTAGTRYALALEKIAQQNSLDILAINDVAQEMHDCFGLRPCLSNPRMSNSGVVCMEADIAAGIAMRVLRLFTNCSPFYSELLTADLKNNELLLGHAGYHDLSNSDPSSPIKIVADIEYQDSDLFTGACTYFKYQSGPVTAVNCVYDGSVLRFTVFEGQSLSGPPKLEGICHLVCKLDFPVRNLYETAISLGGSQHWVVVPGHWAKQLQVLCEWINIGYVHINP